MNKTLIIAIGTALIVGGGGFYAGIKYDQSKNGGAARSLGALGFANLTPAERTARVEQFGGLSMGGRGGMRMGGGGFISGSVLSIDDKSITIKMGSGISGQGGSKIVFLSDSTKIMKSIEASLKDIIVGQEVTVAGKTNSDGSITAESLQIKPALKVNQ